MIKKNISRAVLLLFLTTCLCAAAHFGTFYVSAGCPLPEYCSDDGIRFRPITSVRTSRPTYAMKKYGNTGAYDERARLMLVGDLMCLRGQQSAAKKGGICDFDPCFELVRPIFNKADLVIGNLETLVSASSPTTEEVKNASDGNPRCNAPKEELSALRRAGFDVLVTANNHVCDCGRTGIEETLDMLETFGFATVGAHHFENEGITKNYVLMDVNGISVAVLSTTHIVNQRSYLTSEEMSVMVNCFDREKLSADIADARRNGAEFVIVYCHWGSENTCRLRDSQIEDAKFVAEAGADLVIGSHPHCLQRQSEYVTGDGRTVPVMYSMGNFISSMARDINNDTIILDVNISRRADGTVGIDDYTTIPCYVYPGTYVVTPIATDGSITGGTLYNSLQRIRNALSGNTDY